MKNTFVLVCVALFFLACQAPSTQETTTTNDTTNISLPAEETNVVEQGSTFDTASIAISPTIISDPTFINLSEQYAYDNKKQLTKATKIVYFIDSKYYILEGNYFGSRIRPVEGKTFDQNELVGHIEKIITDAGGKKVFEGKISNELNETARKELGQLFYDNIEAYGFVGYANTWTYIIRNPDQFTWIQLNESDDRSSLNMAVLQHK